MNKTVALKILLRNDTAENWTTANPILGQGEMGIEIDTQKFKFGDGVTPWILLPYGSGSNYIAGNGIVLNDNEISLDDLILNCGTSTTNI